MSCPSPKVDPGLMTVAPTAFTIGHVVSHVGLNNDANWKDFREFDLEDQQVFRDWLESQGRPADAADRDGDGQGHPRRFDEEMLVHGELIIRAHRHSVPLRREPDPLRHLRAR